MLLNPYFWVALALSWLVVGVSVYEHEETSFNKERAIAQAALDAANKHALEVTNDREQRIAKISSDLAASQAKADKFAKDLHSGIASGAVRLSIPIASCSSVSNDSSSASGNTEARADLDAGVSQSLVSITERGDQAINQLNACISAYNSLLEIK